MTKLAPIRIASLFFALFFALLILISVYQISVSLMHGLLEDELNSWKHRQIEPSSYTNWQQKEALVKLLASLSPFNGLVLENSARFYLLGSVIASQSPDNVASAPAHRFSALQLIRSALVKQPIWPLAWMDLAFIKSSARSFDDEFQFAFSQALAIGSAERDVLRGMSDIGFAYWRDLSAANRFLFLDMLDNAVRRDQKYVMKVARLHHREYIPCRLIKEKSRVARACKK